MRDTPKNRLWMKGRIGERANNWKGIKAGYHAVHLWLTKHYKKGNKCDECGTTKASRLEWANISGQYKRKRSDYKVLCPRCHRLLDIDNKCRNGHPYTPKNTLINIRGHRHCKICRDEKRTKNASN